VPVEPPRKPLVPNAFAGERFPSALDAALRGAGYPLPAAYDAPEPQGRSPIPVGYLPDGFQGRPGERGWENRARAAYEVNRSRFAREVIAGGPPSVNQAYPIY
jgi:hypothetical protein